MAAPDELAREEADLRAQREEGAKKALKVGLAASHQQDTFYAGLLQRHAQGCHTD